MASASLASNWTARRAALRAASRDAVASAPISDVAVESCMISSLAFRAAWMALSIRVPACSIERPISADVTASFSVEDASESDSADVDFPDEASSPA
jgi:hypothetical protein